MAGVGRADLLEDGVAVGRGVRTLVCSKYPGATAAGLVIDAGLGASDPGQELEEGRLAPSVLADDEDPVVGADAEPEIPDQGPSGLVAEADSPSTLRTYLPVERLVGELELEGLELLELLLLVPSWPGSSCATGPGPVSWALAWNLSMNSWISFALPLVVDPRLLVGLLVQGDLVVELARVALDLADLAPVDGHGVGDDLVHEAPVVGDQHELARPGDEETLEPADGRDVEVVVRLVEEEHVVVGQEDLGQVQPDLDSRPRARPGASRRSAGREAEAGQDLLDPPDLVARRPAAGPRSASSEDRFVGEVDLLVARSRSGSCAGWRSPRRRAPRGR